jgi:hypothetical protein
MRRTLASLMPAARGMARVDQCVALAGLLRHIHHPLHVPFREVYPEGWRNEAVTATPTERDED